MIEIPLIALLVAFVFLPFIAFCIGAVIGMLFSPEAMLRRYDKRRKAERS